MYKLSFLQVSLTEKYCKLEIKTLTIKNKFTIHSGTLSNYAFAKMPSADIIPFKLKKVFFMAPYY